MFKSGVRYVLSFLGLIIAIAGFVVFTTAAIGVWSVKARVDDETAKLATRAHEATNTADRTVDLVREVISKAEGDLAEARKHAVKSPPQPVNPLVKVTAQQASKKLAGSVEQAQTAVVTAADAVVVANSVLKMFGEREEFQEWLGVSPEQVSETRAQLDKASTELSQARAILGEQPTPEQLNAVQSAIDQARSFTDRTKEVVTKIRARVDDTKRKADMWTLRIAIGTSIIGGLAALGQFFMARFCWRKLRGLPA
ncbi:MAG: hypothetical protein L0241_19455 [Planctomycetia bacterium]|nr:hypothetical protein [Planctomycetia bacterium]